MKRGYELALPGCYDVAERVKEQEQDGIDAEVLYPSLLFNVYQVEDLNIVKDTFSVFNDWITDYVSPAPDRLFALGAVQLWDLDQAIEEMERCKSMGHVGICVPITAPPDHLYVDTWYDKFWAAAQDLEMSAEHAPVHGRDREPRPSRPGRPPAAQTAPMGFAGAAFTIADMIQSGRHRAVPQPEGRDH